MKVGFAQINCELGNKQNNIDKAVKLIESVEADILVLPELFNTGYLFSSQEELKEVSEEIPNGKTTQILIEVAKKRSLCIIAGIAEIFNGISYNSAVMVTNEGFIGNYRKSHLFMNEKTLFQNGDTGFNVFKYKNINIGIMVCFDWWFPESARLLALKGAHVICHPSNLVLPYCQRAMETRSLENKVFSITCNRVGTDTKGDKKLEFKGQSQVVNTNGEVILKASTDKEEVMVVEINPLESENKNLTPLNSLFEDRRIDLYQSICEK